jgi:D-amino-acid dehydrogenase
MTYSAPKESTGIAVIGGGVVGLSTAVFAQRAGLSVTLYEPLAPGGGASFGNSGLISVDGCVPLSFPGMLRKVPGWLSDPLGPLTVKPAYFTKALPFLVQRIRAGRMDRVIASSDALRALHRQSLDHYRALLGQVHFQDLIRVAGAVQILEGESATKGELIADVLWKRHGIVPQLLDELELRQLVPEISPRIKRALLFPNNAHTVNPYRLVRTLGDLFRDAGGQLRQEQVMKILPVSSASYRIITNTGDHRADKVVVAGGAWTKQLLAPLGVRMPLETERGYHVMIKNPSVELRIPIMHRGRGFALVPMEGGLRLAGTIEIAGLHATMNEQRAERILLQGKELLPKLEGDDVSIWMGHRPSLPDSLPAIEEIQGQSGLFVACGHGHTGVTAAAVTGRMVTQMILKQTPVVDPRPYRLGRFQ